MSKVFIINGCAESGKDTFIKLFEEKQQSNYKVYNYSTIDYIRDFLQAYNIIEKTDEVRELMSSIKNGIENIQKNAINDKCIEFIEGCISKQNNFFCFIHCREPHNIEYLKTELNRKIITETILISRPDTIDKFKCSKDLNENIINYDYDYKIINDDYEDFKLDVLYFLEDQCEKIKTKEQLLLEKIYDEITKWESAFLLENDTFVELDNYISSI